MNRRGFLSAVAGVGSLAAVPFASVATPLSPSTVPGADPVPSPKEVLHGPDAPIRSAFEQYADHALDAFVDELVEVPKFDLQPVTWLGETTRIAVFRPFLPNEDVRSSGHVHDYLLVNMDRQTTRGIETPHSGYSEQTVKNAKLAGREMAQEILDDYKRGARGLVLAGNPGHAPPGPYYETLYPHKGSAAIRAVRYYALCEDALYIRFDALFGWEQPLGPGQYRGSGRYMQIVRAA